MIQAALEPELQAITDQLKTGAIGVLPTDTIYGLVARALDSKAVERVYEVRRRRPDKPCIILIADIKDLEQFGMATPEDTLRVVGRLWPGAVSIVLPCDNSPAGGEFSYLHRGTKTLAFRLPDNDVLRSMLRNTGPLIAPSANPEGMKPAATIQQAREYFGDSVDFYLPVSTDVDAPLVSEPSTLVEIKNGRLVVLRQGGFKIPKDLAT